MKRTFVYFVFLMMVVTVANAQGYDFMFNNVSSNTTTNVKPMKSVSVNQLAQASARRSASTRTTRRSATTTAAQQTQTQPQYSDVQQQVMDMANAQQKTVLCGEVTNVYNDGNQLILTVRTAGMMGGKFDYALRGYNSNVEIHRGDKIYFAATYTGTSLPEILPTEFLDYTGMQRYMTETANLYYGGNYGLMLSSNGQMSKWNRVLMNVTSTAMTIGTLVALVKSIF